MEKIAKKQIESFTGLTDFYLGEITHASNHDGFIHSPQGFKFELYNHSKITSLSGMEDNIRGKRSNLNIYDESGFISENYISTTKAFATQNSSFKLGGDTDSELIPFTLPNQLLFCSSASSIDTYFYSIYKEWSKMMFAGSSDHFVCDLNCDVVIGATNRGKKLFVPLLTQEKVDDELRANKEKANREYYNKFDTDGGSQQPIKRAEIIKNSVVRKPILYNDTNTRRHFGIFYDPAHDYDNAAVTVAEYIHDPVVGWKMDIVNCISLIDIGKKNKTPMRTPEQVAYIKQMFLDYNGTEFADYENLDIFMIDAGSGGGGNLIPDYFMEDWEDKQGNIHRGLIDKESEHRSKFPNAVTKLKQVSPKKYRTEMFDDLVENLNLGLITFTESYDSKGYLMLPKVNKIDTDQVEYEKVNLTLDEELALRNIDLAKEEIVMTYRVDNGQGNYKYELAPEKKNTAHDDRAYTLAMAAYYLKLLRRERITKKKVKKDDMDIARLFSSSRQPVIRKR